MLSPETKKVPPIVYIINTVIKYQNKITSTRQTTPISRSRVSITLPFLCPTIRLSKTNKQYQIADLKLFTHLKSRNYLALRTSFNHFYFWNKITVICIVLVILRLAFRANHFTFASLCISFFAIISFVTIPV